MEIKIGSRTINVREYCYAKIGDTENMAYEIDGTGGYDFEAVKDTVAEILFDELDKEYDNESDRC